MKSIVLALLAALCFDTAMPVCLAQERSWTEITLAEKDGLKAVARFRNRASLADSDWLQLEILNSGPAGRIKSAQLDAPSESDNRSFSDALSLTPLGVPDNSHPLSSTGNVIPEGVYTSSAPAIFAGTTFGLPKADERVVMHLTLTLELQDGRSLKMSKPGASLAFVWTRPDAPQIEDLQQQAVSLLAKAIPNAKALSLAEETMMRGLLTAEETSSKVTLNQALAALKQRQLERSFRFSEVMALVFRRWKMDPAVIAFYRDALQTRGPEAVSDLAQFAVSIWDDSLVEPTVEVVETAARRPVNDLAVSRGIEFLARNYSSWSGNASISPRLSKAVVEASPGITNGFYNIVRLLALTHDRTMIEFLRPYLEDKTIDRFTSLSSNMPSGVTPMRNSELAANGISRLLGEPDIFPEWKRQKVPGDGSYPEWAEWDKQIASLQQRLAAMRKQ